MTTATIEKGPTGVDLHWPRTTVNKESRWKLAQWAAIAGAAMIGVDPVVNSFVLPTASQALGMDSGVRALASSIATLILTAGLLGAVRWVTGLVDAASSSSEPDHCAWRTGIDVRNEFRPIHPRPRHCRHRYGRIVRHGHRDDPGGHEAGHAAQGLRKMFAFTAVGGLVAILGSGVLVFVGGWRLGFSLNVICAVGVALFAMFAIPENKASKRRAFDYKGVILAAAALLLFMYGLGETGAKGWGDPVVLLCIFGGLALGVLFVWVEKREPDASFPLAVFKIPAVVAATVALVAAGIAQGSAQANLTELMQTAGGYSSSMVSIIALPMVIFGVIGALPPVRWLPRVFQFVWFSCSPSD